MYQHDFRHVDVLVESLGFENGNTVQTPTVDDMKDENPVWLDPEQTSKYRSLVARCFFFSQYRADTNTRRERVVPESVRSITTQLFQIEATRSVFEGRGTTDPSFRIRAHELRGDSFLRSSAEAELYAAALGGSEAKGVQSMMRDKCF